MKNVLIALFLEFTFHNVSFTYIKTLKNTLTHLLKDLRRGKFFTVEEFGFKNLWEFFPVDDFVIVELSKEATPLDGLLDVGGDEGLYFLYGLLEYFLAEFLVVDFLEEGGFVEGLDEGALVFHRVEDVVKCAFSVVAFLSLVGSLVG